MNIDDIQLQPAIQKAIKELGFEEWMPIQEKCIPEILNGKDVFGQSATGSGKTAAFGLPFLNKFQSSKSVQALVLTPTRELCVQVSAALEEFSKYMHVRVVSIYGGVSISPQIDALKRADIVVGTPGRILDHLDRGTLRLDTVHYLVLDEADKMFEMGFVEDVERIIHATSSHRQTLLFSATLPTTIINLAKKHLKNPLTLKSESYVDRSLLKQSYYDVGFREKFSLLVHLLKHHTKGMAMVFCATRREVDIIAKNLKVQSIHALPIHGGMTQSKRLEVLDMLKKEKIRVLVATDVAARGLDIKNISHVYNYDVPKTSDEYIHRIGRTARAGKSGEAVTLLSDRDYENFTQVLRDRSLQIKQMDIPNMQRVAFRRDEPREEYRSGPRGRMGGRREEGRGSYGGRGDDRRSSYGHTHQGGRPKTIYADIGR